MKMKKDTKKQLMVGFIAFTMLFSTVAWVIYGGAPLTQENTGEFKMPDKFVVDGNLSQAVAAQLYQRGYSLMDWHYFENCCPDLMLFVELLPSEMENQIFIQKFSDSNTTWASVRSLRGEQSWNVTDASQLLGPLCEILLKPPVECGLMQFGNESG